jgi:undecaprenyl-diphosphatase
MDIIDAIILGIVEGITEFLPVSSTGHLMLTGHLLGIEQTAFVSSFEIAIQLGAIASIVMLYPKRLMMDSRTIIRVAMGFIPTVILGLVFYRIIKTYLMAHVEIVLITLFIGGIAILIFEKQSQGKEAGLTVNELPLRKAAMIGALQAIAFVPGVSRSLATIMGGMWLGLSRKEAVEFSFFLAVPTMAAATGFDLFKHIESFSSDDLILLLAGGVASFVTALFATKWLVRFVSTHDLSIFGWYRIGVSLFLAGVFFYWPGI